VIIAVDGIGGKAVVTGPRIKKLPRFP